MTESMKIYVKRASEDDMQASGPAAKKSKVNYILTLNYGEGFIN